MTSARKATALGSAISLIVLIVVIAIFGIYVAFSVNNTTTSIGGNKTYTVCTDPNPPPRGVFLHILTDTGSPVSGVQVYNRGSIQVVCSPSEELNGTVSQTNSTGWAYFEGYFGSYVLSFNYSNFRYKFTLVGDMNAWTIVQLAFPRGG